MPHDYIPRPDDTFSAWATNYYVALKNWWDEQGWDPAQLDPLSEAFDAWTVAHPAHVAAQAAAQAARNAKVAARASLEGTIRPLAAIVQASPAATNADRARMGLTPRLMGATPVPPPTTRPRVQVLAATRLMHELRLTDESTPTRKARPKGVQRAELFVALTSPSQPAPTDLSLYRYVGSAIRGATTLTFESPQGGMQAHYVARWVTTRGGLGPWSATASATVAA